MKSVISVLLVSKFIEILLPFIQETLKNQYDHFSWFSFQICFDKVSLSWEYSHPLNQFSPACMPPTGTQKNLPGTCLPLKI